jgi:hypothetical protein
LDPADRQRLSVGTGFAVDPIPESGSNQQDKHHERNIPRRVAWGGFSFALRQAGQVPMRSRTCARRLKRRPDLSRALVTLPGILVQATVNHALQYRRQRRSNQRRAFAQDGGA